MLPVIQAGHMMAAHWSLTTILWTTTDMGPMWPVSLLVVVSGTSAINSTWFTPENVQLISASRFTGVAPKAKLLAFKVFTSAVSGIISSRLVQKYLGSQAYQWFTQPRL